MDTSAIVTKAMVAALQYRAKMQLKNNQPLCVFDFVEDQGVEVRIVNKSMEGMYSNHPKPTIILPSTKHRPAGRRAFSCAHELGHHVFEHGTRIDELNTQIRYSNIDEGFDPDEFMADCFAGFLLMPKTLISHAFSVRGIDISTCTPHDIYSVSCWIGVGYETLIKHMTYSLRMIDRPHSIKLLKTSPKKVKKEMMQEEITSNLTVVDHHWHSKAIDAEVDDLIIVPKGTQVKGTYIEHVGDLPGRLILQAQRQGFEKAYCGTTNWSAFIRVSRKNYVGRTQFRHLEDPDDK